MDNLSTGEKIAGIAGIALLLIMFIFNWFTAEPIDFNAWEAFGFIDIVVFLAALAGIALAVVAATQSTVNLPVAMSAITAGLGILAVLLILFRIIDPPDVEVGGISADDVGVDVGRSIGVWLGFIAAAAVAYGGWRAMEEEGTSFGEQADRLGDDTSPPPPPPPPPTSQGPAA